MDINEEVENESIQELERILRKWENDDTLVLSQIECLPGSRQGDNYMSIIKRVKIEGKWKNNENGKFVILVTFFADFKFNSFSSPLYNS